MKKKINKVHFGSNSTFHNVVINFKIHKKMTERFVSIAGFGPTPIHASYRMLALAMVSQFYLDLTYEQAEFLTNLM